MYFCFVLRFLLQVNLNAFSFLVSVCLSLFFPLQAITVRRRTQKRRREDREEKREEDGRKKRSDSEGKEEEKGAEEVGRVRRLRGTRLFSSSWKHRTSMSMSLHISIWTQVTHETEEDKSKAKDAGQAWEARERQAWKVKVDRTWGIKKWLNVRTTM